MPANVTLKRVHQHLNLHIVFLCLALSLSLSLFIKLQFYLFLHLEGFRIHNSFLGILCFNISLFFLQCLCPRTLIAKVLRADTFHIMKLLTYIFYLTKLICPCKPWVGKFAPRMYQEQHM